jgi:hypothetical protein
MMMMEQGVFRWPEMRTFIMDSFLEMKNLLPFSSTGHPPVVVSPS